MPLFYERSLLPAAKMEESEPKHFCLFHGPVVLHSIKSPFFNAKYTAVEGVIGTIHNEQEFREMNKYSVPSVTVTYPLPQDELHVQNVDIGYESVDSDSSSGPKKASSGCKNTSHGCGTGTSTSTQSKSRARKTSDSKDSGKSTGTEPTHSAQSWTPPRAIITDKNETPPVAYEFHHGMATNVRPVATSDKEEFLKKRIARVFTQCTKKHKPEN